MHSTQQPASLYGEGDRIQLLKQILADLGQPDRSYPIIHLAGTNGKGSTGRMIGAILEAMGLQVGYFMSPHIELIEETILINGKMISPEAYAAYAARLEDYPLSVFEESVLVALLYFKDQEVDTLILETGMGGALDATNIVENSQYAIFTPISLDHTAILGASLEEIALTKSGIIRPGSRVLLADPQDDAVRNIIQQKASHWVEKKNWKIEEVDGAYIVNDEFTVHLGLHGHYQRLNLATVLDWYVDYCELTQQEVSWPLVDRALSKVRLPGRYEQFQCDKQRIILDVAHNPAAMEEFTKSFAVESAGYKAALVIGFLKDKDVQTMVKELLTLDVDLLLSQPDHPERALPVEDLEKILKKIAPERTFTSFPDPLTALKHTQKYEVVGVVGSFYTIKPVRKELVDHD